MPSETGGDNSRDCKAGEEFIGKVQGAGCRVQGARRLRSETTGPSVKNLPGRQI
jgi:hypothetical protein